MMDFTMMNYIGKARTLVISLTALMTAPMANAVLAEEVDFRMLPAVKSAKATESLLLDIARTDGRIVAVGERGFIVYSDDEGETWSQADVPVSVTLTAVSFPVPGKGWAVGHEGIILYSGDSGKTWSVQLTGVDVARQEADFAQSVVDSLAEEIEQVSEDERLDMEYALEDAQYALDEALAAIDGGGTTNPFMEVWFADERIGMAMGAYGLIFRTEDGGATWKIWSRELDNPDKYHYYSLSALDARRLFMSGEAGMLFRSADGGLTWDRLDSPYEGSFFGVLAFDNGEGPRVLAYGLRGNIFRSEDQGETWEEVSTQSEATLMGGVRAEDGHIVLVGRAGAVLTSTDDGVVFNALVREDRNTYSSVMMARRGGIILVGENGIHLGDESGKAR
jgi:photosystem II stability/assembly factor-like uncharacterized protein